MERYNVRTLGIRKWNEREANRSEHRELAEDVHIVLDTFYSDFVPKFGGPVNLCL